MSAVAGGVAANTRLRQVLRHEAEDSGWQLFLAPPVLCTDNAAMIAYAGYCHLEAGRRDGLDLDSFARGTVQTWR